MKHIRRFGYSGLVETYCGIVLDSEHIWKYVGRLSALEMLDDYDRGDRESVLLCKHCVKSMEWLERLPTELDL